MFGVGYDRVRQDSPSGQRKMFRAGQGIYAPRNLDHLAQMTKSELLNLSGELNETLSSVLRNFDQDGQILKRSPIAIRLYRTGGFNIPHNTWTPIEWDAVQNQTDTKLFSSSSPTRITIPETGWYFVGANANLQNAAGTIRRVAIRKNGSATATDWLVRSGAALDVYGGASAGWSVMSVAYLETGDYIEALFFQADNAAATRALNISSGHPRFVAYLIDRKIRA